MANKQTIKQAKSSIKTDPSPADKPARKREHETRRHNPRTRSGSAAAQTDAAAALPEASSKRGDVLQNAIEVLDQAGARAEPVLEDPPMRIYIIGDDGITRCRQQPAAVNEGEIAVASSAEFHAARLNGKRLLALWNALPGVEKRSKVGDREALIDQLWSAIEMLPDPELQSDAKRASKQDAVIAMLRRPEGVTVDDVASATGWQRHTVRGVFSGTLKKKLGLILASAKEERGRVYRIAEPASV